MMESASFVELCEQCGKAITFECHIDSVASILEGRGWSYREGRLLCDKCTPKPEGRKLFPGVV